MTSVTDLGETIGRVAAEAGPSVVGLGRGWGRGSGVVIGDGLVLTNAHNLRADEAGLVRADGERARGEVLGADGHLDIAVLSVDTGDRTAAGVGEPSGLPIGTPVVALANPGGRGLRATLGFTSSAGRSFRGPRGRRVRDAIEHTAVLPRGSSGGPLLDLDGRLLGLNSLRLEGGLILAVPGTERVRRRVDQLARGEDPRRRGSAWRWPRPGSPAGCGGPWGCRSAPACSCGASRTARRRMPPASSGATCWRARRARAGLRGRALRRPRRGGRRRQPGADRRARDRGAGGHRYLRREQPQRRDGRRRRDGQERGRSDPLRVGRRDGGRRPPTDAFYRRVRATTSGPLFAGMPPDLPGARGRLAGRRSSAGPRATRRSRGDTRTCSPSTAASRSPRSSASAGSS